MARLTVRQIEDLARSIVAAKPGGINYSTLRQEISERSPETSKNTIGGAVWNLHEKFPREISKPSRGLFVPTGGARNEAVTVGNAEQVTPAGIRVSESDFYEPFAEWLKQDLDEVTAVAPLGGAGLKSKWGTPDVVGTYKPLASDLIKFPIEIVSAEIKIDPQAPVVAFGQSVAYRLFSTKTYIAMSTTITAEDQARLESLCMLFGVGLVLFELNKDAPAFSIRMRAHRFSPDMFYVNEFAERLKSHNDELFNQLFG
jgi:hypothetical protein